MNNFPRNGNILASSCIIASMVNPKMHNPPSISNYRILFEKRSGQSSFMPNTYVFPGGKVEETDGHPNWLEKFPSLSTFEDWKLRISAIRETFEETGILLGFNSTLLSEIPRGKIMEWRNMVYDNPAAFSSVIENVTSDFLLSKLHPWHRFVAPSFVKKKFDTMFYLTLLENETGTLHQSIEVNRNEVDRLEWLAPEEALFKFSKREIDLAPPQWYMLQELTQFPTILCLQKEVSRRPYPVEFQPYLIDIENAPDKQQYNVCLALPGDAKHHEKPGNRNDIHRIMWKQGKNANYDLRCNLSKPLFSVANISPKL